MTDTPPRHSNRSAEEAALTYALDNDLPGLHDCLSALSDSDLCALLLALHRLERAAYRARVAHSRKVIEARRGADTVSHD
jgi:hypothetical protein